MNNIIHYFFVMLYFLCLIVFFLCFPLSTLMMNTSMHSFPSVMNTTVLSRKSVSYSFTEAIARYSKNNTIFLMLVDSGYFNQFLNAYYVGNLKQYDNLLVVCLDTKSCSKLSKMKIHSVFLSDQTASTEEYTVEKSPLFTKKMQNKLNIIYIALLNGYNVFYMDSDIILFKNPFPYLYSIKSYDMLVQKDAYICSGFMFIYSKKSTIDLLKLAISYQEDDQLAIIHAHKQKKNVDLYFLPTDTFTNGKIFWSNHSFYWDPIDSKQIMVHNNYVYYREIKDYRFKEMHLYALDVNKEYSDPNGRYLTIEILPSICVHRYLL